MIGVFKLETQMTSGNGKFERTGIGSNSKAKEAMDNAYKYLKANSKNISGNISTTTKDYLVHVQDLNGIGMTMKLTLPTIIAICSVALKKPVLSSLAVLGTVPPELVGSFNLIFYKSAEDAVFKALGAE